MPEITTPSRKKLVRHDDMPPPPIAPASFVELGVTTPFSFLRGASDAIELVLAALEMGMDAIGVADRNTLAGVVRMHSAAKGAGLKPLIGCRLEMVDDAEACLDFARHERNRFDLSPTVRPERSQGTLSLLAYPRNRQAYGRLSKLLSLGKMRSAKGECDLLLSEVALQAEGMALIAVPGEDLDAFEEAFPVLCVALPGMEHVAAAHHYRGDDLARIERLDRLAKAHGRSILATNDVHYHEPSRRPLQDVMSCIREKVTLVEAGLLLNPNAERHLKPPAEMERLFARWPHAIAATRAVADSIDFSLDELK